MESIFISGISGGAAGIITDLIFFPIETIKTRIQASNKQIDYTQTAKHSNKYRGLIAQVTVSFPYAFIFFYTYDQTKQHLQTTSPVLRHMLAASMGEIMSNLFKNPFEVVKNQMQVGLNTSVRDTIRSIYVKQGFGGFYSGFNTIVLREIPFSGIQFPIYEKLKQIRGNDGFIDSAINGGLAGGIAAFLTTPCDVLKSKLMTQRNQYYSSLGDCIRNVYQNEGMMGFFRAAHVRTGQIATSGIVFFSAYERCKQILTLNNNVIS